MQMHIFINSVKVICGEFAHYVIFAVNLLIMYIKKIIKIYVTFAVTPFVKRADTFINLLMTKICFLPVYNFIICANQSSVKITLVDKLEDIHANAEHRIER